MGYEFTRRRSYSGWKTAAFSEDTWKQKAALPNSLVMRMMEEPEAEKEADLLSRDITSKTPDDIMREMGGRLGADFSNVRFHTDPASAERSDALGARGWTQGRDVYFGKGGFDPAVAAHELVHTVQQGAVEGNAAQSIPMGAVQLKPKDESRDEEEEILQNVKVDRDSDFQALLTQVFSTQRGARIYHALEGDLNKLIRKGAGRGYRRCSKEAGISFLVRAVEKDYMGKTLLANIMKRSAETDHFARKRLFDYQELIQFLSNRLRESDLEEAAMDANVMAGPPKYEHNNPKERKRAYELQVPGKDSEEIDFNPTNDPDLKRFKEEIDHADDARQAYSIFGRFTGNSSAKYVNKDRRETNLPELKKKLLNMARVIRDYPELYGQIGNMTVADPAKQSFYMGAVETFGGREKAQLHYNAFYDTDQGRAKRDQELGKWGPGYFSGNIHFAGTHELGHVLASTLIDTDSDTEASRLQNSNYNESAIMESVLKDPEVMPPEYYQNLNRYTDKDVEKMRTDRGTPRVVKGAIHSKTNGLFTNGYTSRYGAETPGEFFAEAFHDVYANGENAKKASIATVQEYEKRQKILTAKKFYRKKRGLWRRLMNWFKM